MKFFKYTNLLRGFFSVFVNRGGSGDQYWYSMIRMSVDSHFAGVSDFSQSEEKGLIRSECKLSLSSKLDIAQFSKSINGESLKPFGTCRTVDFWFALSVQKWSSLPTGRVRWWTINCNYVASKMLVNLLLFLSPSFWEELIGRSQRTSKRERS